MTGEQEQDEVSHSKWVVAWLAFSILPAALLGSVIQVALWNSGGDPVLMRITLADALMYIVYVAVFVKFGGDDLLEVVRRAA